MRKISLAEVRLLPNGTRVYVKCVGSEWCLDENTMKSWNIKQEDGLHYEIEDEEHTISFPYDHDYEGVNMDIICYIKSTKTKYNDVVMKAVRQNMGLEENDESADNEIMQMDEKEVFKAYCHWNGLLGNYYSTLMKTVENIFGVELE